MKTGAGRIKGRAFERDTIKQLRDLGFEANDTFGSGSGEEKGDVLFEKYMVECKFHRELSDKQVDAFWVKLTKEAEDAELSPLLLFKTNNHRPVVMYWDECTKSLSRRMAYWDEWLDDNKPEDD